MNAIFRKLVENSGGWEKLLYTTLKELSANKRNNSPGLEASFEEARTLLEMYQVEMREKGMTRLDSGILQIGNEKVSGRVEVADRNPVGVPSTEEVKESQNYSKPVAKVTPLPNPEKPKPKPKRVYLTVFVDSLIGSSQGALPLSPGYEITNRENLTITTTGGIEIGRADKDGQVKGSEAVTGYIKMDGGYRLVFKETQLGTAIINCDVVQKE